MRMTLVKVRKNKVKMMLTRKTMKMRLKVRETKSDEPNTNGPGKTENAEWSPVNTVSDVLVGGVSADLVDNEEDR